MVERSPSGQAVAADAVEPVPVSPVPASILSAWLFLSDGEIGMREDELIYVLGRYGDVFGPLPAVMFNPDIWSGNMLHASHDAIAVSACPTPWRVVIPADAQAIEARRAATLGAVHESAVGETDAPNLSPPARLEGEEA